MSVCIVFKQLGAFQEVFLYIAISDGGRVYCVAAVCVVACAFMMRINKQIMVFVFGKLTSTA